MLLLNVDQHEFNQQWEYFKAIFDPHLNRLDLFSVGEGDAWRDHITTNGNREYFGHEMVDRTTLYNQISFAISLHEWQIDQLEANEP